MITSNIPRPTYSVGQGQLFLRQLECLKKLANRIQIIQTVREAALKEGIQAPNTCSTFTSSVTATMTPSTVSRIHPMWYPTTDERAKEWSKRIIWVSAQGQRPQIEINLPTQSNKSTQTDMPINPAVVTQPQLIAIPTPQAAATGWIVPYLPPVSQSWIPQPAFHPRMHMQHAYRPRRHFWVNKQNQFTKVGRKGRPRPY